MKKTLYLFITFLCFNFLNAQDISFAKVGDDIIYLEDFLSIYNKNKDLSDTIIDPIELEEYLDLYVKFKLKVVEAKSLGMDTLASFKRELEGYRRQLAKSYLTDNEVTNQLLDEAYSRLKEEVNVSHILIKVDPDSSPNDTLVAFNKAKMIQNEAKENDNFSQLARKYSDDPSVEKNNGELGYFSALYMLYPFENAAYNTNVGGISNPVRTRYGYHILKVNDRRDSRGEVKVSHIMISLNPKSNNDSIAEKKINEIYDLLNSGEDFSSLAKKYSDDKKSASNGGNLDWFGSNKMYESFELAAFNLEEKGDFSNPIKTPAGWHIIRLNDKKGLPSFQDIESSLKSRVEKDSRSQKSRDSLIKKLKQDFLFKEKKSSLKLIYNLINEDFFNSESKSNELIKGNGNVLFTLNFDDKINKYYQKDFVDFLISFKKNFRAKENVEVIINELYKTFTEQKILSFEDENLEFRYDDFRLLINEYHDGILLFELMDQKVWSKAAKDTTGLSLFFNNNINNYLFPNRILTKSYFCNSSNYKKVERSILKGMSDEKILSKFNRKSLLNLSIEDSIFYSEEQDDVIYNKLNNNDKGFIYSNIDKDDPSSIEIIQIIDFLSPSPKKFKDIKGIVISDYQKYLEDEWLKILQEKYEVIINTDLLAALKDNNLHNYLHSLSIMIDDSKKTPKYSGSFNSAFIKASRELGVGKSIYFEWNGNIYTTELAP